MKRLSYFIILCAWLAILAFPVQADNFFNQRAAIIGSGGGCTASYGPELTTAARAIDPDADDADSFEGWIDVASGLDSVDADPSLGTYHFRATADANDDRFYIQWGTSYTITDDTFVKITYDAKVDNGTNYWGFSLGSGQYKNIYSLSNTTLNQTSYTSYTYYTNLREGNGGTSFDNDYMVLSERNDLGTIDFDDLSITEATLCYGTPIYNSGSADNPSSESNGIGSWTAVDTTVAESLSTGTPQNGTYHIHLNANSMINGRAYIDLSAILTDTKKYRLDIWTKYAAGDSSYITFSNDTTVGSDIVITVYSSGDSTYEHFVEVFTYSSTYRYLLWYEMGSNNNAEVYIDNLEFQEVTDE